MDRFRGDISDVRYELLQIPAGLFQLGGVNDDLHQLQKENDNFRLNKTVFGLHGLCECV